MSAYELDLGFMYNSIKNRSRTLSQVEAKAANNGNLYQDFGADLFNGLIQAHPQLKDAPQSLYTETLQAVQNSTSFSRIRSQTQGNVNWSAIGASILLDELTSNVDYADEPPPPSDPPPGDPSPKDNEDKDEQDKDEPEGNSDNPESEPDDEANEDSDGEGNGEGDEEDEDNEDGEGNGDGDDDLEDELDEGEDEANEPESEPVPVSQRIQDAVDKAGEKLGEMLAGLKAGTGGGLSGDDPLMVEGFTRLAQNPSLTRILQRIGRLKLNNNFLTALQVGGPEETYGVTWGNKLEHIMPTELAGLAGNDDEFMVWADRYNKANLQQKQFKSNAKPGKGPMIVCVDISSSMGGQPMEWAKTIAAAMYLLAVKEKRAYACVPFNGRAWSLEPKDQTKLDPDFLAKVTNLQANGGTVYDAAWNISVGFMDKVKRGVWSHADIVFITDGECGFAKAKWLADKAKFGVRLFSFLLGVEEPPPVPPAVQVFTPEYLRTNYSHMADKSDAELNTLYKHLMGQPVDSWMRGNNYAELIDTSDAVVYVPKFDDESVANSFELVKNAKQRKGQMVGAKR